MNSIIKNQMLETIYLMKLKGKEIHISIHTFFHVNHHYNTSTALGKNKKSTETMQTLMHFEISFIKVAKKGKESIFLLKSFRVLS